MSEEIKCKIVGAMWVVDKNNWITIHNALNSALNYCHAKHDTPRDIKKWNVIDKGSDCDLAYGLNGKGWYCHIQKMPIREYPENYDKSYQ